VVPKIVIIDDHFMICQLLADILKEESVQIFIAPSCLEAIDIIANEKPDLMLMDVNIPIIDGFQMIQQLRKRKMSLPYYVITGFSYFNRTSSDFKDDFFCGLIEKPFEIEAIQRLIRKHFEVHPPSLFSKFLNRNTLPKMV